VLAAMTVNLHWRITIFWARVVSALIGLVALVAAIILIPGFPNILLSLVAASLWSLISSFFIYLVTDNRPSLDHWILQLSFEVSNIFVNFGAFVGVLLLIYVPILGGPKIPSSAGNNLALVSNAFTLLSGLLWTTSSICLIVHVRRANALLAARERRPQSLLVAQRPNRSSRTLNASSDTLWQKGDMTSSKGSRSAEANIPVEEKRASKRGSRLLGSRLHRSVFIEHFSDASKSDASNKA